MTLTGIVTITSASPRLSCAGLLDDQDTPITLTGGYGGWEATARARRTSLTEWTGRAPFQMVFPLLLDTFIAGGGVEGPIASLEEMATVPDGAIEPPVVRATGPLPKVGIDWVIADLVPGAYIRDEVDEYRTRQLFTVTLLEHVPAPILITSDFKRTAGKRYRRHTVVAGETIRSIARDLAPRHSTPTQLKAFQYHLRKLNGLRPSEKLKAGRVLLIP